MSEGIIETIEDRQRQVYHLRRGGMSLTEISQRLGMSYHVTAGDFRTFQKKAIGDFGPEDRASLMALELDRLDALQAAVWDAAMSGDVKAVSSVLAVMNLRGKYLGLEMSHQQDSQNIANVLIVGEGQQSFIEALTIGRQKLTGATPDDEGEQKEGE